MTKLKLPNLSSDTGLPDIYIENSTSRVEIFDKIISGITKLCRGDVLFKKYYFYLDEKYRLEIKKYIDNNINHVKKILRNNDCNFYTCTNYCPLLEITSAIMGEPYFEYLFDEKDENYNKIKIRFCHLLLKNNVIFTKCFIKGKYYEISFNSLNTNFKVLDNSKISLKLEYDNSFYEYSVLVYNVDFCA